MARIGLDNFLYGILTEASDGTATYGEAKKPGKAINCSVSISNNSATLYADNTLAESDTSFQNGTVTIEVDNEDIQIQADLLGHTVDTETGAMVKNANDIAQYVGFGRIITKMVNGAYKYTVKFLHKVKFSEPSNDDATKGETVEFGTTSMEGVVSTLADGKWSTEATFNTKTEAQTYLSSFFTASV